MTNQDSSPNQAGSHKDLETLIREAELRVLAADREWQRHGDALSMALRSQAGTAKKVGIWGGVSLAVAGAGVGLLRWRSAARAKAEARTVVGRVKGLAAGTKGLAKGFAQDVADKWSGRSTAAAPPAAAVPRRPASFWEAVVTTAGLLLGAAARSGSKSTAGRPGGGLTTLLFSAGLPLLTRWWRSRAESQQPRR